jgi:hypothetical protein
MMLLNWQVFPDNIYIQIIEYKYYLSFNVNSIVKNITLRACKFPDLTDKTLFMFTKSLM